MIVTKGKISEAVIIKFNEAASIPSHDNMIKVVFCAKISSRKHHVGLQYAPNNVKVGDFVNYDNGICNYIKAKVMAIRF